MFYAFSDASGLYAFLRNDSNHNLNSYRCRAGPPGGKPPYSHPYWGPSTDQLVEVPPGVILGSSQRVRKKNRTSLVNHWPDKDSKRATGQKPCVWEILDTKWCDAVESSLWCFKYSLFESNLTVNHRQLESRETHRRSSSRLGCSQAPYSPSCRFPAANTDIGDISRALTSFGIMWPYVSDQHARPLSTSLHRNVSVCAAETFITRAACCRQLRVDLCGL